MSELKWLCEWANCSDCSDLQYPDCDIDRPIRQPLCCPKGAVGDVFSQAHAVIDACEGALRAFETSYVTARESDEKHSRALGREAVALISKYKKDE